MIRSALLAASAALCPTAFATGAEGEPIKLFNGQDLGGWTAVLAEEGADPDDVWSVEDGVLTCTGTPVGYIRTVESYGDYTLTVQWRFPEGSTGGNSGVLVHTSDPGAIGIWPTSIEVQLFKDNAGDFWTIGTDLDVPDEESRKMGRRHLNLTDGSEKPIGEWNTMEIVCKGDTIRVTVNGDLVNEADHCTATSGAICLQSEGAPIEFREVVLTPLGE